MRGRSLVSTGSKAISSGTKPTAKLLSNTKVLADVAELPIWGFDGSSTNQAPGDSSDCVL